MLYALIAAYNEEKTAADVIKDTLKYVDKVIFVNDGSIDKTLDVVESKFSRNKKIIILSWEKNRGKGYALIEGFKKFLNLRGDILVTLDADGQHSPSFIPSLVQPIESESADIIIGSRLIGKIDYSIRRTFFNIFTSFFVFLVTGKFYGDVASGFRAYSSDAIEKTLPQIQTSDYSIELEILRAAKINKLRVNSVPIKVKKGKKATFFKLFKAYYKFAWKYKGEIFKRILG